MKLGINLHVKHTSCAGAIISSGNSLTSRPLNVVTVTRVMDFLRPNFELAITILDLVGVYTFRSSDRPVGPTGLSDWSVRRSYRVNASSDRSDRRSEESNMFDFVRPSVRPVGRSVYTIRSSDRPDGPTGLSDWSVRRSFRLNASSDRRTDGRRIKHV